MPIHILKTPTSMQEVRTVAIEWYGTMIKGTVDILENKVAIGGDYHMETCELLVEDGSSHMNVWGFNIRFDEGQGALLEFDSLVNIKPSLGNKSRSVEDQNVIDLFEFGHKVLESLQKYRSKGAQQISVQYNVNQGQVVNIKNVKPEDSCKILEGEHTV